MGYSGKARPYDTSNSETVSTLNAVGSQLPVFPSDGSRLQHANTKRTGRRELSELLSPRRHTVLRKKIGECDILIRRGIFGMRKCRGRWVRLYNIEGKLVYTNMRLCAHHKTLAEARWKVTTIECSDLLERKRKMITRCESRNPANNMQCGLPAQHEGNHQNGLSVGTWSDPTTQEKAPEQLDLIKDRTARDVLIRAAMHLSQNDRWDHGDADAVNIVCDMLKWGFVLSTRGQGKIA